MRGGNRNKTCSTFTKRHILLDVAKERNKGNHGGGSGRSKWDLNYDLNSPSGFYVPMDNGGMLMAAPEAQNLGPTVTLSLVDPNSGTNGDVDVYLYGTNLNITTAVAFKKSGVTYTSTYIEWNADLLGTPPAPNLYVEIPASLTAIGVYSIVITNSYGSTEFPAMFTWNE